MEPKRDADTEDAPSTPAEVKRWLKEHRSRRSSARFPISPGSAAARQCRRKSSPSLKPTYLPVSIFFQGVTGDYVEFDGDQDYTEGDLALVPDLSTMKPAPWAKSPTAQVIHDVQWQNGAEVEYAPRTVLKKVVGSTRTRVGSRWLHRKSNSI